ncbi:MAG: metal ABC transporter ATP-binding protein [Akkermansia sp.]|nr:metal ABC transporter ATP-binding protein [Akkermansia sp.]
MVTTHDHICWGGGVHHHGGHNLTVSGLRVSYRDVEALRDISFSTHCGHTLALMGPNGAGKSTLIHALAGFVQAQAGTMLWNGQDLLHTRHEIAFVPQRSAVDWQFPITVRQLVEMGRYPTLGIWKRVSEHDKHIVNKALETLQLGDLQHRRIGELSGGQQQRAFLARALAQEAHILLLDEPFTGLDVPGMQSLGQQLRQLADEGRLIIASHHNLNNAAELFDQTLLLNKETIAFGATADVLCPEHLHRAFGFSPAATTHL